LHIVRCNYSGSDGDEQLSRCDRVSFGYVKAGYNSVYTGLNGMFHLHRLNDENFLVFSHCVADGDGDAKDGAKNWGRNVVGA
jgi:hypothetical protein